MTISPYQNGSGGLAAPAAIQPPAGASNALAAIQASREVAEVQAAMVIARSFPRDHMRATEQILNACTRPSLANAALYTYSRGGSDVSGPSIRLAETAAQCWGNIQFGIRELEQRDGESTVEAFAWDIETNTRQVKVFQVAHERHTRRGVNRLTDPRDIYELVANQGARRLRACILGVIPGDVIEAAVAQCEATMKATADTGPDAQKALLERFGEFGVTKAQIEKRIQRRLDAIQPAQVVALRGIYRSLKDGMSRPSDWFDEETGATIAPPPGAPTAPAQLPEAQPQAQAQAPAEAQPQAAATPEAAPPQQEPALATIRRGRPRSAAPQAQQAPEPPQAEEPQSQAPAEVPQEAPQGGGDESVTQEAFIG